MCLYQFDECLALCTTGCSGAYKLARTEICDGGKLGKYEQKQDRFTGILACAACREYLSWPFQGDHAETGGATIISHVRDMRLDSPSEEGLSNEDKGPAREPFIEESDKAAEWPDAIGARSEESCPDTIEDEESTTMSEAERTRQSFPRIQHLSEALRSLQLQGHAIIDDSGSDQTVLNMRGQDTPEKP